MTDSQIIKCSDLVKQYEEQTKFLKDRIKIEDGWIILNFQYPYEIALSRIENERDLLAWVVHLSGKTWMDMERVRFFICLISIHKNFNIESLP